MKITKNIEFFVAYIWTIHTMVTTLTFLTRISITSGFYNRYKYVSYVNDYLLHSITSRKTVISRWTRWSWNSIRRNIREIQNDKNETYLLHLWYRMHQLDLLCPFCPFRKKRIIRSKFNISHHLLVGRVSQHHLFLLSFLVNHQYPNGKKTSLISWYQWKIWIHTK